LEQQRILVVGATGYIGGRLVPRLLREGHAVRCLARDPGRLAGRNWQGVEACQGDVLKPETLPPCLEGMDVAYYLVHSMGSGVDQFEQRDQEAARHFARAARAAGVKRIIYLGGLGRGDDRSPHLRSRQEVGDILRREGPAITEFRAAIIVGSGSLSFEMIRYLTERVPVMICPRWVRTRCQPVAIDDVLRYLILSLQEPGSCGQVLEIGGSDVLTYADMMKEYARLRGLKRCLIPVPVLTPRLSSYWVDLVTPIPAYLSHPLIEGLRSEVVCHERTALEIFPFQPMTYREAVQEALNRASTSDVETVWSTPLSRSRLPATPVQLTTRDGMILEQRQQQVQASARQVFNTFMGIGGDRGWFAHNWAWRWRAFLDRLVGGVGMRRGRRHPDELYPGEALDFWRVEAVEANKLLRLRAEMKVPGQAWLQFEVEEETSGGCCLTQKAFFEPRGVAGLLYWHGLYPFHQLIFRGMIRRIAQRAEDAEDANSPTKGNPTEMVTC
jgi:uncharacterized protein YbjT (DUF2867 family)